MNLIFFITLLIFINYCKCSYDPGVQSIQLNYNQNTFSDIRSFFMNSSINVNIDCIVKTDFIFELSIERLDCLPVTDKANSTLSKPKITKKHKLIECSKDSLLPNENIGIEEEGLYAFMLSINSPDEFPKVNYSANFKISMSGPYGFLSRVDWPFLPFYATMCVVYSIYALIWLVLCALHWNDILRIQFWIGGVIALGMFEKAMFLGELDSIRKTGITTEATIIVAEIISSLKRTLARMLVIIACLGFGIVKPRLGEDLHKVTIVGIAFFIFSSIEGISRSIKDRVDPSMSGRLVLLLLAVIDAIICFWILLSIIRTIKLLHMRKNQAKLSLYRHFRNTLIVGVIVSTVFLLWNFFTFTIAKCIYMWKEIWCVEAVWHVLFSSLLLVIIILWRPSANNQRYAYSAVYDVDDGEISQNSNEAFGDVKKKKKEKSTDCDSALIPLLCVHG